MPTSHTLSLPEAPWQKKATILKYCLFVYLAAWFGGIYCLFNSVDSVFPYLFGICLLSYIVCIIFAFLIQLALNQSGLYKSGAWQIIVGAFLLNPFVLGFWIPLSTLLKAGQCTTEWRSQQESQTATLA